MVTSLSHNLPQLLAASIAPATSGSEWWWFVFGMCGNVIFGSRFFIQWIHSERYGESRIPTIFWWFSVFGTMVLFTYFLHRREWVAICGNGPQLIPYTRNLMLVYRKKRKDREAEARGFTVIVPAGHEASEI